MQFSDTLLEHCRHLAVEIRAHFVVNDPAKEAMEVCKGALTRSTVYKGVMGGHPHDVILTIHDALGPAIAAAFLEKQGDDCYIVNSHMLGTFSDTRQLDLLLLLMASEVAGYRGATRIGHCLQDYAGDRYMFVLLKNRLGFYWLDANDKRTDTFDGFTKKKKDGVIMRYCFKDCRPIFRSPPHVCVYFASCLILRDLKDIAGCKCDIFITYGARGRLSLRLAEEEYEVVEHVMDPEYPWEKVAEEAVKYERLLLQ